MERSLSFMVQNTESCKTEDPSSLLSVIHVPMMKCDTILKDLTCGFRDESLVGQIGLLLRI